MILTRHEGCWPQFTQLKSDDNLAWWHKNVIVNYQENVFLSSKLSDQLGTAVYMQGTVIPNSTCQNILWHDPSCHCIILTLARFLLLESGLWGNAFCLLSLSVQPTLTYHNSPHLRSLYTCPFTAQPSFLTSPLTSLSLHSFFPLLWLRHIPCTGQHPANTHACTMTRALGNYDTAGTP